MVISNRGSTHVFRNERENCWIYTSKNKTHSEKLKERSGDLWTNKSPNSFDETSRKAIRAHGLIRVKLKDSLRDVFNRGEGCHNSSMPAWELEHKKSVRLWNQFGVEMVVEQFASQRMLWKWLIVMIPIENRVVTEVTRSEQEETNGVDSHTHFPY